MDSNQPNKLNTFEKLIQYDQIDIMSLRFSKSGDLNYCDNVHKIHQ